MGRFYGKKILAGTMTLDEVPDIWEKATDKWLEANK